MISHPKTLVRKRKFQNNSYNFNNNGNNYNSNNNNNDYNNDNNRNQDCSNTFTVFNIRIK